MATVIRMMMVLMMMMTAVLILMMVVDGIAYGLRLLHASDGGTGDHYDD